MPFIQNTEEEIQTMLQAIKLSELEELFTPISEDLRKQAKLDGIRPSLSEADVLRELTQLSEKNHHGTQGTSFLGAGIEEHFIPHIVDHISLDGNFITAYTPYQPEVSQGTLTAIFQFQSFMSAITGLPVSNASLYDGATAVVEAVIAAWRYADKKYRKENRQSVLVPETLHPEYRATLATYAQAADFKIVSIGYDSDSGYLDQNSLQKAMEQEDVFAALLPYPNFFGVVEDFAGLIKDLHDRGILAIAVTHPLTLSLLKSPGELGCDIAVGEGQSLGCYQAFGGPAFGFFSCSDDLLRFAPGRIVSQTVDKEGKRAFCLALSTREQHIRRAKATSNICTNQGLMALRALIYLAALGKEGFQELGRTIASTAHYASEAFAQAGLQLRFQNSAFFQEFVLEGPDDFLERAKAAHITGGLKLKRFYPELENSFLVSFNELHTKEDIDRFVQLYANA